MQQTSELPEGWALAKVSDICHLINGRAFKPNEWAEKGLPIIRIQNLNNIEAQFNYCDFDVDTKYYVNSGQLLFAWSGTPGTSFGSHVWNRGQAVLNQHIFRVEIDESKINKLFLKHLLNYNVAGYIEKAHGTSGLAHITKKKFEESILAIPPFPEQHRIVAAVEALFSRLDAANERLERVPDILKRFRQAVLAAACDGRLTEDWRAENPDVKKVFSTISVKTEKKHKQKNSIETDKLKELPDSWNYRSLPEIVAENKNSIKRGPFGSSIKKSYFVPSGYKVYEQKNVIYNDFTLGNYYLGEEKYEELKDFEIKPQDILISCSGTVGKIAIVPENIETGVINQALLKLTLDKKNVLPEYFIHHFNLKVQEIISANTRGSAMLNISSVKDLKQIPFAIPPLPEQHEIVRRVDALFALADKIETQVAAARERTEKMRQSILAKAFSGELVETEAELARREGRDYEPADVLLERIKAEKAQ